MISALLLTSLSFSKKVSIEFLGFHISKDGIRPSSHKTQIIRDFPQPNDTKSLRSFFGLLNYRHLIPNFANIVLPLTELGRLNQKNQSIEMNDEEVSALNEIKDTMCNISSLSHPFPGVHTLHLVTDSSQYAIGAALHQLVDGKPIPIGFFSKKLSQN